MLYNTGQVTIIKSIGGFRDVEALGALGQRMRWPAIIYK